MKFTAEVRVELKKGVTDPEGTSTKKALNLLGFKNIKAVKSIKVFQLLINDKSVASAKNKLKAMCERLLANPVIHKYSIKIKMIK